MDAEDVVAWDKAAAAKSAAYHGCPTTVQLDHATREVVRSTPKNGVSIDQTTEYDARGNRRAEYDAFKRLIHIYEYDMQGQIIHDTGLDSTPSRTVYDHEGKPVLTFLGEAVQKRFTYDALSRQTAVRITIDNGKSALWKKTVYGETVADASQKNLKGMTFQVYDQSGVHTNTAFDFKGNLTSETVQLAADYKEMIDWTKDNNVLEKPVYTASFEYDGQNRTTTSTDAHGAITRKIYNQTGQLKTITWRGIRDSRWTSYVSRTSYTADGRVSKCEYGNGAVTTCTHDPATRLLTTQRTTRGSGAILEDISHYYDCNGRITHTINDAQKDVFFQGSHVGADKDFTYDSYGQLIQARGREQVHTQSGSIRSFQAYKSAKPSARSTLPGDGSQLASYTETYDYDLVGNLLQMRHEATTDRTIAGWTRSYSYSAPSQLDATQKSNKLTATEVGGVREEYSYAGHSGARGCMTSVPGYSSLTWDAQDMLRSSSTQVYKDGTPETTWYVYDSEGRRVRKVTERAAAKATSPVKLKETIDVLSSEFYFEYAGDGKTTSAEKRTSSVSGASVVALVENLMTPDGAKQFIRYRIGGNMELNESGQLISYEEYSPFGATTYAACAKDIEVSNRGRYSNYLRDEETGFYHCGARYFAPWLGRWISADPIGTGDGPNRYRYASNDPINMADPEGTCRNHRPDALDMFLGGAGLHPKIQSMWYAERTGGKTLQEHKVEQREIRRKDGKGS
jgi:RHS repeat-associated protein